MSKNNFLMIQNNWEYVLPPSRPSVIELGRIRAYLINIDRNLPIAVLGSTIEFRNLLHQMGFKAIYIFEKNKEFYSWTKNWMCYDTADEKIIWGDWLDNLSKYEDFFKVILSDLTMGNINYTDRLQFYSDIHRMLVEGGAFIDKVLTHNKPHIPLQLLGEQYQNMPLNLETVNRFNCEVIFCSDLLDVGVIDTSIFYDNLNARFKNSKILMAFIDKCHLITPENCLWYYGKFWDDLEVEYSHNYSMVLSYDDVPSSPYYGRAKHFFNIK